MKFLRCLSLIAAVAGSMMAARAADPKRVLLVTHSGGFVHNSVTEAEKVLTEIGPKNGFVVTTYRYTGPTTGPAFEKYKKSFKASTKEDVDLKHCGHVNKETLKNFDCVLFFTTGSGPQTSKKDIGPLTLEELTDLKDWVKAGGAFCGTHCASDTLYETPYGELIGGYFKTHPPGFQGIVLHVDDPKHPAAVGFTEGMKYLDEIYVFQDSPYSRDKVNVILSVKKGQFEEVLDGIKQKNKNFNPEGVKRKDGDYAISWSKEYGKGKVFYTSLGHRKEVWNDEKFQSHLIAGMKYAMGEAKTAK
ncbi:MAG: ThuA domain-containing protein [Gemmataceae bacterium]